MEKSSSMYFKSLLTVYRQCDGNTSGETTWMDTGSLSPLKALDSTVAYYSPGIIVHLDALDWRAL